MIKNLIKTALRHIVKHPGYSILNVLGLFGLASYMVEQRTKEIGIRKELLAISCQFINDL